MKKLVGSCALVIGLFCLMSFTDLDKRGDRLRETVECCCGECVCRDCSCETNCGECVGCRDYEECGACDYCRGWDGDRRGRRGYYRDRRDRYYEGHCCDTPRDRYDRRHYRRGGCCGRCD